MTVTTTAASSSARLRPELSDFRVIYALGVPWLVVVFVMASCGRQGRNYGGLPTILFGIIMVLGMSSCGTDSSKIGNPGTPIGASTITVTASGSGTGTASHSVSLKMTVVQ